MTVELLNTNLCCGCAACEDKCPKNAIQMLEDARGNRRPFVNKNYCISCGICTKVCPSFHDIKYKSVEKKSYIGLFNQKDSVLLSSSGGIFLVLAQYILSQHGVVYGAAMRFEDNRLQCKHIRVDKFDELYLLQGSKYVQSHTDGIFSQVLEDLNNGKQVLFSGTSCQIASLKRFVGVFDNLYTIDLICHGVPQDRLFNDYITYLDNKNKGKVINISFRKKGVFYHGEEINKILTYQVKKYNGTDVTRSLFHTQSAYYCLFMNRAGYRDSCYYCRFASSDKPSDITLGDFTQSQDEVIKYHLDKLESYSSIIVHNEVGMKLLNQVKDMLFMTEIPIEYMLDRHGNLNQPSEITKEGKMMYYVYLSGGFSKLQRITDYYLVRSKVRFYLDSIIKYLKR